MPAPRPSLTLTDVRDAIVAHLHASVPVESLGLELEWLVRNPRQPAHRPSHAEVEAAVEHAGPLPSGGHLTIEPGGQLELVTTPHTDVESLCEAAATDLLHADRACTDLGLELVATGCDPQRPPERVTEAGRYRAMHEHFDAVNEHGVRMMCNTASIQLNVGRGGDTGEELRWRVANLIGPTLLATFANSPFDENGPTGWASTRWRCWTSMDATRTAPVALDAPLEAAWQRYVLDAWVMLMRNTADEAVSIPPGFTFERWLHEGHELGHPTADDLAYHLTTLFPPVRPKGWFELRMLDTLPTPFWHVATAVAAALLHADVQADAVRAIDGSEGLWVEAARHGLAHPLLASSAERSISLAREHLAATGADDGLQAVVATFDERWTRAGRCPADDQLDRLHATGDVWPSPVTPIPFAALEASLR